MTGRSKNLLKRRIARLTKRLRVAEGASAAWERAYRSARHHEDQLHKRIWAAFDAGDVNGPTTRELLDLGIFDFAVLCELRVAERDMARNIRRQLFGDPDGQMPRL